MGVPVWSQAKRTVTSLVFPGADVVQSPDELRATLRPGEELLEATTARDERLALLRRPPASPFGRYVIFFYGNAMTMADTAVIRDVLADGGSGVLCVDYPGYGGSSGEASEAGCYRAASAALDLLVERYGVQDADVDVVGWSLGSAVAADLAGRRNVRRLVLLSPFAGVSSFVLGQVRRGATPLTRFGPFSGRRASSIAAPTLLVSGDVDRVTPTAMAQDLAGRIGAHAELMIVPGAGHNDLFSHAEVWRRVMDFLGE